LIIIIISIMYTGCQPGLICCPSPKSEETGFRHCVIHD
jgi:hypothetical protein